MKLNNIFPNYETFKSDVIDKLNLLFPNVEWLNEQNSYMSFQTLYGLLSLYYGDRDIRYDNSQTFINKFTFDLADLLPDIYAKQQVFITNELTKYLSSAQNRAIKVSGIANSNRTQNNNSKAANSTTPTNIVITSPNELNNLPITSANLSNIELIDNINSDNEQTNFKFIDDLIKNLTTDYSLRLKEFMNLIKNHFTFIDTSSIKKQCDGLYEGTRFRNGYYVSNVDYLGVENQEQINLTNGKIQTNTINIEKLQSAIGSLPNFENMNKQINQNTIDIKQLNDNDNELWEYLEQQYLIDNNLNDMSSFKDKVNQLDQENITQNGSILKNLLSIQNNTNAINSINDSLNWKEITQFTFGSNDGNNYVDLNFTLPSNVKEFAFVGRYKITPNDTNKQGYVAINGVFKNDKDNCFVSCFLQYLGLIVAQFQGGLINKRIRLYNVSGSPITGTAINDNFKIFYR